MELRRLALPIEGAIADAIDQFDCCGEAHADDAVAQEVNGFLRDGSYQLGIEQDLSSTYLWLDVSTDPPTLVGYVTLAFDSVRLSESEKKALDRPDFPDVGAVRLVMIGVDWRHQKGGSGSKLLETATGLALEVGALIAVRFLVADVNRTQQGWYERRMFEINRSQRENDPADPGSTISMRLDLRKS